MSEPPRTTMDLLREGIPWPPHPFEGVVTRIEQQLDRLQALLPPPPPVQEDPTP